MHQELVLEGIKVFFSDLGSRKVLEDLVSFSFGGLEACKSIGCLSEVGNYICQLGVKNFASL
jgi:hypothetical protein